MRRRIGRGQSGRRLGGAHRRLSSRIGVPANAAGSGSTAAFSARGGALAGTGAWWALLGAEAPPASLRLLPRAGQGKRPARGRFHSRAHRGQRVQDLRERGLVQGLDGLDDRDLEMQLLVRSPFHAVLRRGESLDQLQQVPGRPRPTTSASPPTGHAPWCARRSGKRRGVRRAARRALAHGPGAAQRGPDAGQARPA